MNFAIINWQVCMTIAQKPMVIPMLKGIRHVNNVNVKIIIPVLSLERLTILEEGLGL